MFHVSYFILPYKAIFLPRSLNTKVLFLFVCLFFSICACVGNERLTPELGYAVQPSSAVATRVSITVSAAKKEHKVESEFSGCGLRKSYFEYHSTELNCIQAPVITWHYHQWTERRRILHSVSSISARLLLRQETRKAVALCWKECLRASVMLLNAELCIMFPLCEHKTTACASCLCVHACICRMCSHLWRNK